MNRRQLILCSIGALFSLSSTAAVNISREFVATSLIEGGNTVRFEILVSKPPGPGPFPAVIFNHGSTGNGSNPELFRESWSNPAIANYFIEQGWMVLFPQRRGRGASDGLYDEGFELDRSSYSCKTSLSLAGVERAIEDLDAVMAHVRSRTDVRQDRLLLAGQSRGGILAIAFAGKRPDLFTGVINFVGGWMSDRCVNAGAINTPTFRRGGRFPHPTLWLYGNQDPYYSLAHSKSNFEAFVAAGGKGQFEAYEVPGKRSGHFVIEHPRLWSDRLSSYLASLK